MQTESTPLIPDTQPDYGIEAASLPTQIRRKEITAEPYIGAQSYQVHDAEFFFGRHTETREMTSLFLSSPLSVLHAPSGAGKSSLLNARVIRKIEQSGVFCVRLTPQDNPLEALRVSTILQLIPAPEAEAAALQEILDAFPELADEPMESLLDAYDALPAHDSRRRSLIAPFEAQLYLDPDRLRSGVTTPFICRFLAGTVTIFTLWRHLRVFFRFDRIGADIEKGRWKSARLRDVLALLKSDHARAAHREWIDLLDLPDYGFAGFFDLFWEEWAERQRGYSLCLIVDQFEEIFTRFKDSGEAEEKGHAAGPDWRLRPWFFQELQALLSPRNSAQLPISVVLSMRDEFLGELRAVPEIRAMGTDSYYRLEFVDQRDAPSILREPARIYGYDYTDACYKDIVGDLVREERFIVPGHLQIVCQKVWSTLGQGIFETALAEEKLTGQLREIGLEDFRNRTGGTRKILRGYFRETLDMLTDEADRIEAIDVLVPLLTSKGTRNVVEKEELVQAPLRDADQRAAVLKHFQDSNIIRVEARLGGQFAEITHEFLLEPLQHEIARHMREHPEEAGFRIALRALEAARRGGETPMEQARLLSQSNFEVLMEMFDKIVWDDWAADIMLHAAVLHGADHEGYRRLYELSDTCKTSLRMRSRAALQGQSEEEIVERIGVRKANEEWLDQRECDFLLGEYVSSLDGGSEQVGRALTDFAVRSVLHRARRDEADAIRQVIGAATKERSWPMYSTS